MVNGWFRMNDVVLIESCLRHARCSKDLALALMQVTMIAYSNGVTTMAAKSNKKVASSSKPPEDETPKQAFSRLAQGRTNKAVKSISLIAQLTGTAYESTEVQQRAIVTALEASVDQVKEVFAGKAKSSDSFKLPS